MRLKIASRSSDLARIQAFQVARALRFVDPTLQIEFEFRSSLGDRNLDVPLSSWESKGVFTQDFFEDLMVGKFDMVVHSWKDLPTEIRPGTHIAATLERADARDLLLVPKSCVNGKALGILSSSPRRAYNLRALRELLPGDDRRIEFHNVRGNVPTRVDKMFTENKGLILAKAALDRLLSAPEREFQEMQASLRKQIAAVPFRRPAAVSRSAGGRARRAGHRNRRWQRRSHGASCKDQSPVDICVRSTGARNSQKELRRRLPSKNRCSPSLRSRSVFGTCCVARPTAVKF